MRNKLGLKRIGLLFLVVLLVWSGMPTTGVIANKDNHPSKGETVEFDHDEAGKEQVEQDDRAEKQDGHVEEQDDKIMARDNNVEKPDEADASKNIEDETVDHAVKDEPKGAPVDENDDKQKSDHSKKDLPAREPDQSEEKEADEGEEGQLDVGKASESDYTYDNNGDGTATITGYTGNETEIDIPKIINDLTVTHIQSNAFKEKDLTRVGIPDSVTFIGNSAFASNKLEAIQIPDSVTKIDAHAFERNAITDIHFSEGLIHIGVGAFTRNKLAEINIPNSVESIGSAAFNSNELTNVYIPKNVTEMGRAFTFNPLARISVSEENGFFKDVDQKGLYTIDGKTLIQGTISGEIQSGTEEIGGGAFWGMGLTKVDIPNGVKKIGLQAFQENVIEHLSLPDGLETIEKFAFAENKLNKIVVPESVRTIAWGAFQKNELTEAVIFGNPKFGDSVFFAFHENPVQFVLRGYTGTSVEQYAEENNYTFEALDNTFAGGLGTEQYPYIIKTAEQLDKVRNYLDDHFKLGTDIDLSSYVGGEGWEPLGALGKSFTGTLDGNGYTITGLTINRNAGNQGLFGIIGSRGKLRGVKLEDVKISGQEMVGGLVGENSGSIIDSSVTGSEIYGSGPIVGGLVGNNMRDGTITNSNAKIAVRGDGTHVGGLVGQNFGKISTTYAFGNVETPQWGVGGLVGGNTGSITKSYATGNVSGSERVGGFVGVNSNEIKNSYATGTSSSTESTIGGLVGESFGDASVVINSYWNTSPYNGNAPNNGVGTPKTVEELKQRATFQDWDFNKTWYQYEAQTMPFLQWQNPFLTLSIRVDQDALSIGDTAQVEVTALHQEDQYNATLEAEFAVASGSEVVEVNAQGLITAKAKGEATIAVSLYDKTETIPIMVTSGVGPIIFVKEDGTGSGSSWDDATGDLQQAMKDAKDGQQIWIAAGTYIPNDPIDDNDPRTASFQMKNGVEIYGGFAGTENPNTFDLDKRNIAENVTILSGDLAQNDNGTEANKADNAYHVFYHPEGTKLNKTAVLDGVTITGGNANGRGYGQNKGGGMYNEGKGWLSYYYDGSSPTLRNVIITGNHADDSGGGISNMFDSHPTLDHVMIAGNSSNKNGGGMYNVGSSNPQLSSVIIGDNQAGQDGGGLYNSDSNFNLADVTIENNSARDGGGLYVSGYSPVMTDVTIKGNSATRNGGGIYSKNNIGFELTKVSIIENKAATDGGGIYIENGSPQLENVILRNNEATHSGGGIYYADTINSNIQSSTINGNKAQFGGGLFIASGTPSLLAARISGNEAQSGGGMYTRNGRPTLVSTLISGNKAETVGGGTYLGGAARMINVTISGNWAAFDGSGIYNNARSLDIHNSIIWENGYDNIYNNIGSLLKASYSLIGGLNNLGIDGEGNIDANPRFVNPVPSDEAPTIDGDYQLMIGSPVINQGNNSNLNAVPADIDLNGDERIFGDTVDMGAYEFSQELYIESVGKLEDIEVSNGTSKDKIGLPKTVEVTFRNKEKYELKVDWHDSNPAYDGTKAGTYTFTGELQVPAGVENPDHLTAKVNVMVGAPFIAEVVSPDDIQVENGTKLADINFPTKVEIITNNGDTHNVDVSWNKAHPDYDRFVAGKYTFTGTFDELPEGLINPQEIMVNINVIVAKAYIVNVEDQVDIFVKNATPEDDIGLPTQVNIHLNNGRNQPVDVQWSADENKPYNELVPGAYMFHGNLQIPDYVTNPNRLQARVQVTVGNPYVTKIKDLPDMTVEYGTTKVNLPKKIDVISSDGKEVQADILWGEESKPEYNGKLPNTYLFTGEITGLPDDVIYPEDKKVVVKVTVNPGTPNKPDIQVETSDWTNAEKVAVTIKAEDDVEYQLNGTDGKWLYYTDSFNVTDEGITTIYARAVDIGGVYSEEVKATVKIDRTAPEITIKGDNPLILEIGTAYKEPGATAEDDVDRDISGKIEITGEVDTTKLGTYEVYYNVNDRSGNKAMEVIRIVEVVDTTPPELTLNGDSEIQIELGESYQEQGATATDHYDGDVTKQIEITGKVNTEQVGIYEIKYTVKDSSDNISSITRKVRVVDTVPPNNVKLSAKEITTNSVTLEFTAYDLGGIKEFILLRDGKEIAHIDGEETTFTDKDLESGTTYQYSMIAVDMSENKSKEVTLDVVTKEKERIQLEGTEELSGEILPDTATSYYNLLLMGGISIIFATILSWMNRKKKR